ncbi:MAG: zf-TFIIB domain-containing protein [Deltaproteobacteria bacterium]|nr:zf-TFIIB domain-containing protein [Deltaproteobacteria bacterium]MBW2254243.1 zf-TFIIB domain-containing protein [Deltaproteobacteria bacterium]
MPERRQEEEYFTKVEREKKSRLKAKHEKEADALGRKKEKELHWNKCGKCGESMDAKVFRGVEIDICPRCGAVLLDAGELEKLAGYDQSGLLTGIRAMFGG